MEIIIAKKSGLCYGVKRALRIAREIREKKQGKVATLGDLIHNPQVIADLEEEEVYSLQKPSEVDKGTVIIRSHGVSPDIYQELEQKKIAVVDATCPIVKKIQQRVEALAKKGIEVIIVGNRVHPESKGLIGYSLGKGIIIETHEQAIHLPHKKKRAVLAQSTQDLDVFQRVVTALITRTEELQVFNTICQSTQTRQRFTSELASEVDTLFIIGGKNSSNTNKLYQISKKILPNTYFVEKAENITPQMIQGAKKIGISGGASTPPEAIREAAVRINICLKTTIPREKDVQCQS